MLSCVSSYALFVHPPDFTRFSPCFCLLQYSYSYSSHLSQLRTVPTSTRTVIIALSSSASAVLVCCEAGRCAGDAASTVTALSISRACGCIVDKRWVLDDVPKAPSFSPLLVYSHLRRWAAALACEYGNSCAAVVVGVTRCLSTGSCWEVGRSSLSPRCLCRIIQQMARDGFDGFHHGPRLLTSRPA